jgi:hypothetical protein
MRVTQAINLRLHGRDHMRMAMAKTRNRCATRPINHIMPGGIRQPNALAGNGDGRVLQQVAMDDMGHGAGSFTDILPRYAPKG